MRVSSAGTGTGMYGAAGIVLACCLMAVTEAANYTWSGGGGNSNFGTGSNWVGGTAPTGTDDIAIIDNTAVRTPTFNADLTIGGIILRGTVSLAVSGTRSLSFGFCYHLGGGVATFTTGTST